MKELKKDVIEFLVTAKEKTYISEDSAIKEKFEDTSTIMKYTKECFTCLRQSKKISFINKSKNTK